MKKKIIIIFFLFIILSTFNPILPIQSLGFFSIHTIDVQGLNKTNIQKFNNDINYLKNTNILNIDENKVLLLLEKHEWIEDIVISKKYPNKIIIKVKEHSPLILWKKNNKNILISNTFKILEKFENTEITKLPIAKGDFSITDLKNLYEILEANNFDIKNISIFEYLLTDRWDLYLKNNQKIMLGNYDFNTQVKNINKIFAETKNEKLTNIDLRIKNKIYVR